MERGWGCWGPKVVGLRSRDGGDFLGEGPLGPGPDGKGGVREGTVSQGLEVAWMKSGWRGLISGLHTQLGRAF